jgi:hypothetical protein
MGLLKDLSKLFSSESEYGTPSQTLQGETVKSRAEQRIADYFTKNGIRYVYERAAKTDGLIIKRTFAHPDFYLPDFKVYVEYWGLVGASRDYRRTMKWKMAQYHEAHIKFISLYPENLDNLDWVFRAKFKTVVGVELPAKHKAGADQDRFCTGCGTPAVVDGKFCTKCGRAL